MKRRKIQEDSLLEQFSNQKLVDVDLQKKIYGGRLNVT
jgi:hypothetical protein